MQIARAKRNAAVALGLAKIDDLVMQRMLPTMQSCESPVPSYLPLSNALSIEGLGHDQQGQYRTYIDAMTTIFMGAAGRLFGKEHDSKEPYGTIWGLLEDYQKTFRETWDIYAATTAKPNPPFQPFDDERTSLVAGIANNVLTVQAVLLSHQRAEHKKWSPDAGIPYATFLARTALGRGDFLIAPASTKRSVTSKMLAEPTITGETGGVPSCADPLTEVTSYYNILEDPAGRKYWAHQSLRAGRWPEPGNCPGDIKRPASPGADSDTDAFFELAGSYAGLGRTQILRETDGTFRATGVGLICGALVAEHTMFERGM